MSSLRIPDFARLHAMENERAARWKERNNKPPTVPKGFRLTNFQNIQACTVPSQQQRPSIKAFKDEDIAVEDTAKTGKGTNAPSNTDILKQATQQEEFNGQIAASTPISGSKFVNKVKEARVAACERDALPSEMRRDHVASGQSPSQPAAVSERARSSGHEEVAATDRTGECILQLPCGSLHV